MFEEIKTRPCIIEWIGDSHILWHTTGFLPIAVIGDGVAYLSVHNTYDAAKAELVEWLADLNHWEEWLKENDIANYGEIESGEML